MNEFPGMEHQRTGNTEGVPVHLENKAPTINQQNRVKALELAVDMDLPGPMAVTYTLETAERFANYIATGEIRSKKEKKS